MHACTHARRLTAGKGFKDHQAQPLHFSEEKTGPDRQRAPWQSLGAPQTAQASASVQRQFRCLERPQPLHQAPPKLLNSAGPYSCQLSAVAAATNLVEGKDGQCRSLPLYFPPSISSQLLLPSRTMLPKEYSFLGVTMCQKPVIHSISM